MRHPMLGSMAALVLGLAALAPVRAQEVTRQAYAFVNNDLTIEVVADVPGRLRLARGQPGLLEVAARAADGIAAFGLGGEDRSRLRLTAVGAEQVEYVVIVPEEVRVRVQLPDRPVNEVFSTFDAAAEYAWRSAPAASPPPPSPAGNAPAEEGYVAPSTPAGVAIDRIEGLRTVTVRWEGARFGVKANRPFELAGGTAGVLQIRPGGTPLDLVVYLPRDAAEFVLWVGGQPALRVSGGQAAVLCSPVVDQTLDAGRRWFTFTLERGRLTCGPQAPGAPAAGRRAA